MNRAFALLGLLVTSLVLVPPAADASCFVTGTYRERIEDADAAIVGTVIEAGIVDRRAPKTEFGEPLRYTLEVERDLKDNVGERVSFHSGSTGAITSNDFQGRRGERLGLVLHRLDGKLRASDCDKIPPDEMQVAAVPLSPPRGRGVPRLLAAGSFGEPRIAIFDERGDATDYGEGDGDARVAVCPGERMFAEVVSDRSDFSDRGSPASVEIRDARSMKIVRRWSLPPAISGAAWHRPFAISCTDEEARGVLVAAEAGEYSARVVGRTGESWDTLYHGKARAVTFLPDGFAAIRFKAPRFELVVHDSTGDVRSRIGPLPSFTQLAISESVQFVADPSGRFVAGASEQRTDEENLFVADLRTERVVRAAVPWIAGLAWAGTDLVAAPLVEPDADGYIDPSTAGDVRVYDAALHLKHEWSGWTGLNPVVVGDRLFGVRVGKADGLAPGESTIVSAPYRSGPEKVERPIGDLSIDQLVVLSGDRELADRRRANPTWAVYGVIIAVVVIGAIVLRSRRAARDEPVDR